MAAAFNSMDQGETGQSFWSPAGEELECWVAAIVVPNVGRQLHESMAGLSFDIFSEPVALQYRPPVCVRGLRPASSVSWYSSDVKVCTITSSPSGEVTDGNALHDSSRCSFWKKR